MKKIWPAVIFIFSAVWPAHGEPYKKTDFAYGIELQRVNQQALCSFPLPLDVYGKIVRQDMGDMAVFNGRGEVVPFTVWRPPAKQTHSLVRVPFYPLFGPAKMDGENIALMFKIDPRGTLVRIQSRSKTADRRETRAYLVDLSKIETPVNALQIEPQNKDRNFFSNISLSVSDNLRQWRTIVPRETIACFSQAGERLERSLIETNAFNAKYLLLEAMDTQGLVDLEKISARLSVTEEQPHQWLVLTAEPVAQKDGEYAFDLPGFLPIDKVRIKFPQQNTLAKIQFLSRKDKNSPWVLRQGATMYRLSMDNGEILNPDVALSVSGDRHWLIRVDQKGGGLGSGIVRLDVGWTPHLLLFTARGEDPFVLAYGNARIKTPMDHGSSLVREIQEDKKNKVPACTIEGKPPFSIGGEKSLKKSATPEDYKQLALWSILIFAVLAMAFIALMLIRQMAIQKNRGDRL